MNDKATKLLLGVIAFCLAGILLRDTASLVHAQPPTKPATEEKGQSGQAQIAVDRATVYVLLDRKLYIYSWENGLSKELTKSLGGEPKLKQTTVIDLSAAH